MLKIPLQAIAASVVIHALWGGNPVAGKFGLIVFPPYWSAFVRFIFGILTIALWCQYRGTRMWPTKDEWAPLCALTLLFTVQMALMNFGFDGTTGVNATILMSTNPLFGALFAHFLIQSDRLSWQRTMGLVVGFTGVVLTILASNNTGTNITIGSAGDWFCLASAALLGFRLIVSARAMQNLDPIRLAMWQMILSLPLFAFAGYTFETIRWDLLAPAPVLGLAYQGIVVAGIGFMVSLWLISRYRPSVMVAFNFISPVTGVLLSAWLLNEAVGLMVIVGIVALTLGMIVVCNGQVQRK